MSDHATNGVAGETAHEASPSGQAHDVAASGAPDAIPASHAPAPNSDEPAPETATPESIGPGDGQPDAEPAKAETTPAPTPTPTPTPDLPLFAPVWSSKTRARGSLGGPSTSAADMSAARKREAIWLIAATGVSLIGTPIGAVAAILSPMVFDPSQNVWNPAAWIAFVLIVTFWIVCIAAPFGAWVAFLRGQRVLTWLVMSLPALWVIAALASVQFLPG